MRKYNTLDTTGSWEVDGTPIYVPSAGIKVQHTNLTGSETGRTEDGIMHIDWVRRDIRKVSLQYKAMSAQELDYLLDLMQGKEFTLTFRDRGAIRTMQAYSGESSYTYYSANVGGEDLYTDVSINAVEL